jgi:hypothetical protein
VIKIQYRIKTLAQKLPRQTGVINPGVYEQLDEAVVAYQTKLKNLVVIEKEDEEKSENSFTLKLKVEDSKTEGEEDVITPKPKQTYKRKIRRNINDDSN